MRSLFGCLLLATFTLVPNFSQAETTPLHKANYDLAAKWTASKVSKLVFDTSVTPHWFTSGDRFWYTYATSQGRSYWLVDCRAKTRKPLFDRTQMAAMLTQITLNPYDALHLPIRSIKLVKDDTVIQFELILPREGLVRVGDELKAVQDIAWDEDEDMRDKSKDLQQGKIDDKKKEEEKKDEQKKDDGDKKVDDKKTTDAAKPKPNPPTRTLFFQYDLKTEKLTVLPKFKPDPKKMSWASVSPDEKTIVFARGHNLFMMDAASYELARKKETDKTVKETQITTDGEEHFSYAQNLSDDEKKTNQKNEDGRKDYRVPPVGVIWSKDSKKFAIERDDERKVGDLWVINSLSTPRPTLETYRYAMPGEAEQPQTEMSVFDVATLAKVKVKNEKFPDQSTSIEIERIKSIEREKDKVVLKWLSDTSDKLYFTRSSRDRHKVDVCVADTTTGEVKVLIEERLNTYIDQKPLRLVNNGTGILFWSERDGWGHYYLYDINGKLKNRVTAGDFTCESIAGVDEKNSLLYFTACGKEPNEDPYFTHLYRTKLDGTDLKPVDVGAADHSAAMDDDAKFVVDNSSCVNTPPHSVLRDGSGKLLVDLETTDVSALLENGYKYPEPFKVKADDNITDLYGVMYKPFDFDPNKRYPVIEYVYPGPQTESVSKSFSPRSGNMALAQLGFIVIEVGNRGGSPQRSKWYHNYGYGNLRDYGLADKKRAVEELALKYPWIDADRVGITGHSGGGFMSAAAMLVYPDFFKVAFSESGNHENNIYNRWWGESHHGVKETVGKDGKSTFAFDLEGNSALAKNLKGRLMLVTGDMDDNVHPANTTRLVNALIRANKRFDYFEFPGQRHGYGDMSEYCFWMRLDYFARYLLGDDSERGVDIVQLNQDQPQRSR